MLRGEGTTLNSSLGTTVHFGLLRGADDFPKPSLGLQLGALDAQIRPVFDHFVPI